VTVTRRSSNWFVAAVILASTAGTSAVAAPNERGSVPPVCEGVTDSEALARVPRESIDDVQPLRDTTDPLYDSQTYQRGRLVGATVTVRPVRGLTRERLQRILECGFAMAATEGTKTDWPKLPAGTTISVRSGGDSFLVDLRAANEKSADEVLKAALAYKPRA
jgi:hypothetical protein